MVNSSKRWVIAQNSEKQCWEGVRKRLMSKEYRKYKISYWERVLDKLKKDIKLDMTSRVLDAGCGPSGLVLNYPKKSNLFCLDPLMSDYLKSYPYLKKYRAKYISKKIEDFSSEKKFNYVFSFNCLDHVDDISKTLKKLYSVLDEKGILILSINCHNYKFLQKLLFRFSFILDRPHPHQYSLKQYLDFLKKANFKILKTINIDDDILYMAKFSEKDKKNLSLKSIIRNIFHPFTYANLIGIKLFGGEKEKTIYSTYLIIAKK